MACTQAMLSVQSPRPNSIVGHEICHLPTTMQMKAPAAINSVSCTGLVQ